jgi:arabinogalactan oligomer / maltooligosaccharide transport system substrate-binding protein
MKRSILILVLLGVLAMSSLAPVMAQDEEGLLIWADETRADVLLAIGNQFEAEFGVPVTVTQVGLGEGRDQLLEFGPAGEGPDILVAAHDSIGAFVANGAIIPIDLAGMEADFTEGGLNLFTFNDALWGVPYAVETTAFVRNTDLVPDAPATWEEVAALCGELRDAGLAEYGVLIQTGDTYHHSPAWSAFGGYIFGLNEDGSYNTADIGFASDGMFAFGEWLAAQVDSGCMVPDIGDDEIFALFEAGDLAMFMTGPWWSARIAETGVPYAISAFPGTEAGGVPSQLAGGQGFVISAFSENQLLAETFLLDYVATVEGMQQLFDADPRPPAFVGVDTSNEPNLGFYSEAAVTAQPMPAIPEMGAVWAAAGDALTLIAQGNDPVESLTTANEQIALAIDVLLAGSINSITLVGDLQDEAGCEGDWNPACEATFMEDMGDGNWVITVTLPAGEYQYKVAYNGDWAENYGLDGAKDGDNLPLALDAETEITFTFNTDSHLITSSLDE